MERVSTGGTSRTIRFFIAGLGAVGRRFLELLTRQEALLVGRYGLRLVPVGAADSSGAALARQGLAPQNIVALKQAGQGVAAYPQAGRPQAPVRQALASVPCDLLVEATPTNLRDGEPGLGCIRDALARGLPVVTASKGPLVLTYQELHVAAARSGSRLAFSAAVAGGLPTVNLGCRDLAGSNVLRVEGILNSTTNYILTTMAEEGLSFAEALAEAQRRGIAEADPGLDVDGLDAATKLVIVANSVLGRPTALSDLAIAGIRGVTLECLAEARRQGRVLKLLTLAELVEGRYRLSVAPTALDAAQPAHRTLRTAGPGQRELLVPIYEGDRPFAHQNELCAQLRIVLPEGLAAASNVRVGLLAGWRPPARRQRNAGRRRVGRLAGARAGPGRWRAVVAAASCRASYWMAPFSARV